MSRSRITWAAPNPPPPDPASSVSATRIEVCSDGRVVVYANGPVVVHTAANDGGKAAANDTSLKATLEIGAIESAGEHKGEIYGGIWSKEYGGDNKPIWFSAAPKSMDHFNAASWATERGGSLPTRKQGDYLTTLKGKGGAFTELFNRGNSFPAGSVWLADPDPDNSYYAGCQRLSDGAQNLNYRDIELPVLCVFR